MSRLPRLHVPGGFYHVYARGNGRQDVFVDEKDRLRWEQFIGEAVRQYNHRIHAYCWMTNHIHIAVQAGEKPISLFVGAVLSRYAKAFNQKNGRSGHVFERRHGAILVEDDSYLLELVRYIHQNPQRAGIVARISDYRWTSHHAYMGTVRRSWLQTAPVLSIFNRDMRLARRQYAHFVNDKQKQKVIDEIRSGSSFDQRVLGGDKWLSEVLDQSDGDRDYYSLDQLIRSVCCRNGVTESQIASRSRSRANAVIRAEIALVATDLGLATMSEVAKRFGRTLPSLSRAVARLRRGIE